MRHPQTTWNVESRYQGRIDSELRAHGEAQLEAVAAMGKPGDFEVIYSSPLSRARRLAEAVGRAVEIPVLIDDRLTEIAMGPWEGLTRAEIEQRFPVMFQTWHVRPDEVSFPGGESLCDVSSRVGSFIQESFASAPQTSVLIVSHNVVVKMAVMLALGLDNRSLHRFRMRNCSVSVLRGRRLEGSVETIDSQSHLSGSPFRLP